MRRMNIKSGGKALVKLSILLVVLAGCAMVMGCIRGLQPVGWSGVAVSNDMLYVGSTEGRLVAIKSDGGRIWSEPLRSARPSGGCAPAAEGSMGGCASSASAGVAIYGTPVVSGELVYLCAYNGKVYAYNSSSLEMRWIYPREDYLRPVVGGVAVSSGKVYFGTADGRVFALDAATGDKEWEFQAADKIWSTPVVDKGTVYITSFDKKLYALEAEDGAKKWEFPTGGTITATPVVYNDTVYIGSFDRKLYAVDAISGTKKWEFEADKWFWSAPVVHENVVYVSCLDGNVYALDVRNGEKIAYFRVGPLASSPVLAGNLVIVATEAGEIYSIDTVSRNIKKLAELDTHVAAPLAVNKEVVYMHTSDLLVHPVNITTGAKLAPISLKKD